LISEGFIEAVVAREDFGCLVRSIDHLGLTARHES
jgi:hypothetical protein